MRIFNVALAVFGLTGPLQAGDWTPMTGADIKAALTEQTFRYESATQTFYASGRTLYNAGQDSWGYWAARGDQYCSQWPPGDLWECYSMESAEPGVVRFVASHGSFTVGRLVP